MQQQIAIHAMMETPVAIPITMAMLAVKSSSHHSHHSGSSTIVYVGVDIAVKLNTGITALKLLSVANAIVESISWDGIKTLVSISSSVARRRRRLVVSLS